MTITFNGRVVAALLVGAFCGAVAAVAGKPISRRTWWFLVEWLDRYVPKDDSAPQIDCKRRAAGDQDEDAENAQTEATRTVRGSG